LAGNIAVEEMKEKLLYLIFGGLTTLINYIVFYAVFWGVGLAAWLSSVCAWVVAVAFAYVTNKLIVFGSKKTDRQTLARELSSFVTARLMSLGVSAGLIFVFIDWLGFDTAVQSFAVITATQVFTVVFNYFASKYFIFR
jgi:putative flippase GtrA